MDPHAPVRSSPTWLALAMGLVGCTGATDAGPLADAGLEPSDPDTGAATVDAGGVTKLSDGGAEREDGAGERDAGNQAGARALITRGVRVVGRADLSDDTSTAFAWSGSGFELRFRGTGLTVELRSDTEGLVHAVEVDGSPRETITSHTSDSAFELARGLTPGEHRVVLTRETEGQMGTSTLGAIRVADGALIEPGPQPRPLIEIVGDSISAGYGILGADQTCPYSYATQSFVRTYGALTARALGGEAVGIAVSGHGMVRNLDGKTELLLPEAYGLSLTNAPEATWLTTQHPDVIVVNLGTNDYGAPGDDPSLAYRAAYLEFTERLRALHPDALIVAALGSMVTDDGKPSLTRWRDSIAAVLAAREAAGDARMVSIEFPIDAADELGCDWHPNAKKHAAMAAQLTELLRDAGI